MDDVVADSLCLRLADHAERVRWRMTDVPWQALDRSLATPALCALVREMAFSELTTASATRRFLSEHDDDPDFTQWLAVWFYEETRHPQVLLRWLHELGVAVDDDFLRRGRATAPFMKSRIGTLVTNIISEHVATHHYLALARTAEPVLATIARGIAEDEARHAVAFYAYAERALERSADLERDRRDALKVLYMWMEDGAAVRHPVREFYARNAAVIADAKDAAPESPLPLDRIVRVIGHLLDLPLRDRDSVHAHLRGQTP